MYSHFDAGKNTSALFLDIPKAFDSVLHNILFNKLVSYGFGGKLLQVVSSD